MGQEDITGSKEFSWSCVELTWFLDSASPGISSQVQAADQNDKGLHMELGLNKILIKTI